MLDKFSKATGFYIPAINTSGESFFDEEENKFCKYIKSFKCGSEKCKESYKKACRESLK